MVILYSISSISAFLHIFSGESLQKQIQESHTVHFTGGSMVAIMIVLIPAFIMSYLGKENIDMKPRIFTKY